MKKLKAPFFLFVFYYWSWGHTAFARHYGPYTRLNTPHVDGHSTINRSSRYVWALQKFRFKITWWVGQLVCYNSFSYFAGFVSFVRQRYELFIFGDLYWTCKIILVPFFGFSMSGCFFILSMTFERFYSIIKPHKAASFNTVKRAKITILCIIIFFMIFNIPRLFLGKIEGLQCLPYGQGSTFWSQFYFYTEMIISFVFPFISLLFMNSVIIYTFTPKGKAIFFLVYQVGEKSYYTNYAVNFFLYVISGQKFRTDLMKLFLYSKKKARTVSSTSKITTLSHSQIFPNKIRVFWVNKT